MTIWSLAHQYRRRSLLAPVLAISLLAAHLGVAGAAQPPPGSANAPARVPPITYGCSVCDLPDVTVVHIGKSNGDVLVTHEIRIENIGAVPVGAFQVTASPGAPTTMLLTGPDSVSPFPIQVPSLGGNGHLDLEVQTIGCGKTTITVDALNQLNESNENNNSVTFANC
jgi:hypothetical protein